MPARTISKGRIALKWCIEAAGWIVSSCRCLKALLPQCSQQVVPIPSENVLQPEFDPENLNCRVKVQQGREQDILELGICGKVRARQGSQIRLLIHLYDVTDGNRPNRPIYRATPTATLTKEDIFEHVCELGKVPQQSIDIPDWIPVAKIESRWLLPPRSGRRKILLKANLYCCENFQQLAETQCVFNYETPNAGYLDIQRNVERAKALGATLALAISSADGRMYKSEIECIKQWTHNNIHGSSEARKKNSQLERALNKTIRFFRKGCKVNIQRLCEEMTEITPLAYRYDIVGLCLKAVEAKGFVTAGQVESLKNIAAWLRVDVNKFRQMLERLAPATTHQVKDMELLFGISDQMSTDQNLEQLNHQYRKWNARATSIDSEVQNQAEQMLNLIAKARNQYT